MRRLTLIDFLKILNQVLQEEEWKKTVEKIEEAYEAIKNGNIELAIEIMQGLNKGEVPKKSPSAQKLSLDNSIATFFSLLNENEQLRAAIQQLPPESLKVIQEDMQKSMDSDQYNELQSFFSGTQRNC